LGESAQDNALQKYGQQKPAKETYTQYFSWAGSRQRNSNETPLKTSPNIMRKIGAYNAGMTIA